MTDLGVGVSADGLTEDERRAQVWRDLRLVVIDTETTGSGRAIRAVSLAAITVRDQAITGNWGMLINPGVPISKSSTNVHGITDNLVANELAFDEVQSQLLAMLTSQRGDRVVFVAHNAAFDLGVLRAELDRHPDADGVLQELPDLPVLDTWADELHTLAGIRPKRRNLATVAETLGVTLTDAHNATSDAIATAQVAIRLLNRAVAAGHSTFDDIHAAIGGKTTRSHPTTTSIRRDKRQGTLSEAHAASHLRVLPANPDENDWNQWKADITACAASACARLTDRLQMTNYNSEHDRRLRSLTKQLAEPDEDGRVRSAVLNTIAYALAGNLARPITGTTDAIRREQARTSLARWSALLDVAQPCGSEARCPGCAAEDECGRDIWWRPLVPALRGTFPKVPSVPAAADRNKTKVEETKNAYKTALQTVDRWFRPDLKSSAITTSATTHALAARYAVCTIVEWHLAAGRLTAADEVAARAVAYGYLDPRVVNHHLTHLTSARRAGDISTALRICARALNERAGSTDLGWLLLTARQAHLSGIQERRNQPPSGKVDEDGNPIPKRRHHPAAPRRTRSLRFARDPDQNRPTVPGNWVRINEAARQLNTTTLRVAQLAEAGALHTQSVNGLTWFDADELEQHRATLAMPTPAATTKNAARRALPKQTYRRKPAQPKKPRVPRDPGAAKP